MDLREKNNLHGVEVLLSKEQRNFACLVFVCVDFMKLPLKDILAIEIAPKDLYEKIQGSPLEKTLWPVQKKLCFIPKPNEPDYCDFDVSLLYTLIRNLGSSSLIPTRGWKIKKPTDSETKIGDDIVRFNYLRNTIAHAISAKICDNEFNDIWENIRKVVGRMQTFINCSTRYEQKLSAIKTSTIEIVKMMADKCSLESQMAFSGELEENVEPTISINGKGNLFSGETARFSATKENADSWALIWEKVNGRLTERIDVTSEKYKDSRSTDLVILCVSKHDEGLYHASLIQHSEKHRKQISSNDIELHIVEQDTTLIGQKKAIDVQENQDEAQSKMIRKTSKSVSDINEERPPNEISEVQSTRTVYGLEHTGEQAECLSTDVSKKTSTHIQSNLSHPEKPVASVISQLLLNNTAHVVESVNDKRAENSNFDTLFDELAEDFPVKELDRLKQFIMEAIRIESASIDEAKSARDLFQILKDSYYFTPQNVIVMQFLFRETQYKSLFEKCTSYAKESYAEYFEPTEIKGSQSVLVHVKGKVENDIFFSRLQLDISAIIGCKPDEVSIIDIKQESSFVVDISIKESYLYQLLNMKGKDHKRLQRLNVDYFIAAKNICFIEREETDEPEISIIVANGGVRGECTRLIADVTPTDLFGWSLKWQRVKNLKTEKIDINREKFRGSNERQLVIHSMCEEDGGNYQAVLTRDTGGKYQIISSTVCLPITEDLHQPNYSRITIETDETTSHIQDEDSKTFPDVIQSQSTNDELELKELTEGSRMFTEKKCGEYTKIDLQEKTSGTPCLNEIKVTTDLEGITFHYQYKVSDISQEVHVHWSKDGKALSLESDKYFGGGLGECLLKIKSPNSEDIGKYTCTVVKDFGLTSHAVTLDIPKVTVRETKSKDNEQVYRFKAVIESCPAAYNAQWRIESKESKMKGTFYPVNVEAKAYEGTSNSLPCPVLVVKRNEIQSTQCFQIIVTNLVGSTSVLIYVRPNQLYMRSISVLSLSVISHITCATSGNLFISGRGGLSQVDMEGIEWHKIGQNFSFGEHTVTESGDLLFIKEKEIWKLTTNGETRSLITLECKPVSIYSMRVSEDVLLGSNRKLTRYSREGNKIHDIEKDSRGQDLYVKPVYITEQTNGNVTVSDSDKRSVVAVDKWGQYCFEYKGHYPKSDFHPRGICSDLRGNVLVCNSSTENPSVHLLDQNGQFIKILLTKEELKMQTPCALCLKEDQLLYVGYLHNTINVYRYPSDNISDKFHRK